jgi:hypothetical protein
VLHAGEQFELSIGVKITAVANFLSYKGNGVTQCMHLFIGVLKIVLL